MLRRYVHGPGIDEPLVWYEGTGTANRTWLYADHLGSIIGTANSAGTSTAIYRYGPYGEPNVTTGIRFRYTGQQYLGGLNLYYYKARFYSPTLGRFLQTDPIGTRDDLNLYAYVGNNPINFNDPDGLTAAELKALSNTISSWGRDNAGTLAEIGVGFTPAGIYADFYSAATGKTPITGESLSGWERVLVLVPGVSELKNIGRVARGAGKAASKSDDVIHVTKDGVALPPGTKHKIPDNYVQNPHRSGSYGEVVDGKFKEHLRIDSPTPPGQKGPNYSHYHKNGKGTHYSPRLGDKDPGF